MKRMSYGLLLFLFLAAIPCQSPSAAPTKPIQLKMATHMPNMHFHIRKVVVPWVQEVEKRSGGKVKITLFTSQSLGKVKEMYDMAKNGTADMTLVVPAQVPGRFPMQEIFFVPYLIPGGNTDTTGIKIRDMLFKKYLGPIEFRDVRVLWTSRFEPYALQMAEKPVRTIADVQGLSIGMPGGKMVAEFLKALGASPEIVVMPEMYSALDRGMVAGVLMAKEPLLSFKFSEVVKYVTPVHLGSSASFIAMNVKSWNKLPGDVKRVVNELEPWVASLQSQAYAMREERILKVSKAKGVEFIELSPEDRAKLLKETKYIEGMWLANMKRKKLPGKDMLADVYRILGRK